MNALTVILIMGWGTVLGNSIFSNQWRLFKFHRQTNAVSDIVALKSSHIDNKQHIWYHKGILRNPFTGSAVAGIEGIEYSRRIPDTQSHSRYLSKKLFMYVDLNNRTSPLMSFRAQRLSPVRKVQHPVKYFSELVTIGSDGDGHHHSQIEFPSNRTVSTKRIEIVPRSSGSGRGPQQYHIRHFMTAHQRRPPGRLSSSRWVSLVPPSDSSRGKSQEYYDLSAVPRSRNPLSIIGQRIGLVPSPPLATMRYTRYGEGPSWYSVGRAVTVEMEAWKYASPTDLPPHITGLVGRACPGFLPKHSPRHSDGTGAVGRGAVSTSSQQWRRLRALRPATADNKHSNGGADDEFNTLATFRAERDLLDGHQPWYREVVSAGKRAMRWAGAKRPHISQQ